MTKLEAIEQIEYDHCDNCRGRWRGCEGCSYRIALECIQHCIDEEKNAKFTSPYMPEVKEHIISSYNRNIK